MALVFLILLCGVLFHIGGLTSATNDTLIPLSVSALRKIEDVKLESQSNEPYIELYDAARPLCTGSKCKNGKQKQKQTKKAGPNSCSRTRKCHHVFRGGKWRLGCYWVKDCTTVG